MKLRKYKIPFVIFSLAMLFVSSMFVNSGRASTGAKKTLYERIDAHIKGYVKDEDFQGTILVAKKGKIIHKAAYGLSDREKNLKNTIQTQFLIGSLTKSFVAVTVMQLVDDGLVNLHTPIKTYIPDLKNELANDLTLHLLLR